MIGTVVASRYELLNKLSENAIFAVYSARDTVESRDVTVRLVKQPFAGETEFVNKLASVVTETAMVHHPALERSIGLESDGTITALVSEPISGSTLSDRLRKLAAFSVPVSISTAIAVCEGISALHAAGMVHGDISADNVVVQPDGDVKLQLAGIWRAYASSNSAGSVALPQMSPYLAPEISKGGMPNASSDVYSIGVLLYEMLTGRYPFHAETAIAMAMKHITDPVPSVRMMNPSVPQVLDEIIKKAMAKEPVGRYFDAAALAADLRVLQDALRFGKSLTWPITATRVAQVSEAAPVAEPVEVPQPKPKVVKEKRPKVQDFEEVPEKGDVPGWIKSGIAFFAGLLVILILFYVIFNTNRPKDLKVPNLARLTVTEATDKLASQGLKLFVAGKEPSEQFPAEVVLRTDPPSGQKVFEGSTVNVILSSGSRFVEVPDLRGMTVERAKEIAGSLNLSISDRVDTVRDRNVEEGLIVSQVPAPREKHERFTQIKVKVSAGAGRTEVADPSANRKYFYTVVIRLTDIAEAVNLRVDMTDSKGTKTVHESDQEPNAEVEITAEGYGKEVTFRIFYDGELVKSVQQQADETEAT